MFHTIKCLCSMVNNFFNNPNNPNLHPNIDGRDARLSNRVSKISHPRPTVTTASYFNSKFTSLRNHSQFALFESSLFKRDQSKQEEEENFNEYYHDDNAAQHQNYYYSSKMNTLRPAQPTSISIMLFMIICLVLWSDMAQAGKQKDKDEHMMMHMPEGGSRIILPIPLFLPVPFPIIEDIEKIYHRKKVLVVTYPKPKALKPAYPDYKPPSYPEYKPPPYKPPAYGKYSTYNEPYYNANYDEPPPSYTYKPPPTKYGQPYDYYDDSLPYGGSGYGDNYYGSSSKQGTKTGKKSSKYPVTGSGQSFYGSSTYKSKYAAAASEVKTLQNQRTKPKSKYSVSNGDQEFSSSENIPLIYKSSTRGAGSKRPERPKEPQSSASSSSRRRPSASSPKGIRKLPKDSKSTGSMPYESYVEIYKPGKKYGKKTRLYQPNYTFYEPTKFFPHDADAGDDIEHIEWSTDDGKSSGDLNPKNLLNNLRKLLNKEKVNLKVNIDYNKDKVKDERKKEEENRSLGKMIDEQIKKLETEEYLTH